MATANQKQNRAVVNHIRLNGKNYGLGLTKYEDTSIPTGAWFMVKSRRVDLRMSQIEEDGAETDHRKGLDFQRWRLKRNWKAFEVAFPWHDVIHRFYLVERSGRQALERAVQTFAYDRRLKTSDILNVLDESPQQVKVSVL